MQDKSKLVKLVTYDSVELEKQIEEILNPSMFLRVINLLEISFFYSNENKEKFLKYGTEDYSDENLNKYSPEVINLKGIFEDFK